MNDHATPQPAPRQDRGGCGHSHPADGEVHADCRNGKGTSSPCRCGQQQGSCESGCDLECLERPLFTAGMVLSDSDLTALVDWTRTRLALQRYRDGWGVVCGLDVRCDPDRPGWVAVDPGYAVGCCGEDVVLCEPQHVDLTGCCAVETPCPDPRQDDVGKSGIEEGLGWKSGDAHKGSSAKGGRGDPCGDFVVDLVLTPLDSPAVTELVAGCGCGGNCGDQRILPTRLREEALVEAVRVAFPAADPVSAAAERAQAAYSQCHAVVRRYVEESGGKQSAGKDVVAWLRSQDLDPPCQWWATTCATLEAADTEDQVDAAVAAALFDLVVDCRQRLLRRACRPCSAERVGLARVWLRRAEDALGRSSCVVTAVDAYPPYRRQLAPTERPVPPGTDDLAPFLWQRWDQVCHRWRRLAPNSSPPIAEALPNTTRDLLSLFEETARTWWPCGAHAPEPVVVTTPCLGDRVVGFRSHPDNWFGAKAASDDAQAPASTRDIPLEEIAGVGPRTAKRLRDAGISGAEELSLTGREEFTKIAGTRADFDRIHEDAVRIVGTQK